MRALRFAVLCCLCTHFLLASAQTPTKETQCATQTVAQQAATKDDAACKAAHATDSATACVDTGKKLGAANSDLGKCITTADLGTAGANDIPAKVAKLQADLDKQKDSDFELELGIGSLIRNQQATDYLDSSNVLSAANLGGATPQYLIGLGLRTPIPNFRHPGPRKTECEAARDYRKGLKTKEVAEALGSLGCPYWREKPFSGFVSLKFAPQSSDSILGYVLGGSYSAGHYLNILVGFGLSPVNEPSHGLRTTASQYVTAQQKQGNLLNFDPVAMLNNAYNAFDGFSLVDSTGKLIYNGTPLEPHYRGGLIIGVAIPINFADFLKGK